MKTLYCARCRQRIKRAAGWIESGPVGPVCAERLGLPREVKATLRKDGMPRAKPVRVFSRFVAPVVDQAQMALEFA